jgi:hypothetical protein
MFVGLDVHKKYTEVAIVDEDGVASRICFRYALSFLVDNVHLLSHVFDYVRA